MLELIALYYLSRKNKANALARGRKPGFFMAMTFVFWFGLELVGAFAGAFLGGQFGAYLLGLVFAAVGGLLSYLMAKNCKPGEYMTPMSKMTTDISQNAETLDAQAAIRLVREKSISAAALDWSFSLNGQFIGTLANGQEMTVYVQKKQNILTATDSYGNEAVPLKFDIYSGGNAVIYFKSRGFLPAQCTGIDPLSAPVRQNTPQEAATSA